MFETNWKITRNFAFGNHGSSDLLQGKIFESNNVSSFKEFNYSSLFIKVRKNWAMALRALRRPISVMNVTVCTEMVKMIDYLFLVIAFA